MKMWTTILPAATAVAIATGIALAQAQSVARGRAAHPMIQLASETDPISPKQGQPVPSIRRHNFFRDADHEGISAAFPRPTGIVKGSIDESVSLAEKGDVAGAKGDWAAAVTLYQQALAIWSTNGAALYGMGRYAAAAGDTAGAIQYYRARVYLNDHSPDSTAINGGYQENNLDRLMEFTLLLDKAGKDDEALAVYRHGVHLLNYDPGDPTQGVEVRFPEFGPGEWAYTPRRLRAMAQLALGAYGHATDGDLPHLQEALRLAPDSAAAYYYLGKYLLGRDRPASKVALEKAVQLGDERTAKAAKVYLQVLP